MACPEEHDIVASGHKRSAPAARESAARERDVELRHGAHERGQRNRLGADERREVAQDPHDLVALGGLGFA